MEQQAARHRLSHEQRAQLLKSREQPFTFYAADIKKVEARQKGPQAEDPNRFQKPFKANAVPEAILGVSHMRVVLALFSHMIVLATGVVHEVAKQPYFHLTCTQTAGLELCPSLILSLCALTQQTALY